DEHSKQGDDAFRRALEDDVRPHVTTSRAHQRVDALGDMRSALELGRMALARAGVDSIRRFVVLTPRWADPKGWSTWVSALAPRLRNDVTTAQYAALQDDFTTGMVEQTIIAARHAGLDVTKLEAAAGSTDRGATLHAMQALQHEVERKTPTRSEELPPDARFM